MRPPSEDEPFKGQVWETWGEEWDANDGWVYLVVGGLTAAGELRLLNLEEGSMDSAPRRCLETGREGDRVRWRRIA